MYPKSWFFVALTLLFFGLGCNEEEVASARSSCPGPGCECTDTGCSCAAGESCDLDCSSVELRNRDYVRHKPVRS